MADIEKILNGLEKLQEEISRTKSLWTEPTVGALEDAIELLKAQQPKKGHWVMKHRHSKSVKYVTGIDKWGEEHEIQFVEESEGNEPYCSECGAAAAESFLCFCPKCGADMRESLEKDGEQE